MNQLSTHWITSSEEFHSLREEWNELLTHSNCNTLFLTWEWQYTWWINLGQDRELAILTVRDGEQLIAIAPMILRPSNYSRLVPFRVLEMLGVGCVGSDYLSIIIRSCDEGRALTEICRSLVSRKFVLELSNIEHGSSTMTTALSRMRDLGCRTACRTQNFSPYIDLSCHTWESYLAREGTASGSRFKKKLRKLKRTFAVDLERTTEEQNRSDNLDTVIRLHLRRWNERGGSNAFYSRDLHNFHDAFSRLALQRDWLRLYILWLDGVPAAGVYGFYYLGTFYYYQAGFDPQFSQYSVGLLSIGLTIEQAIAEGAREYDLLRGDEGYKYAWANKERELVRLNIYPPTLKGYLCSQMMELRRGVRTLIPSKVPESLHERLHSAGLNGNEFGQGL